MPGSAGTIRACRGKEASSGSPRSTPRACQATRAGSRAVSTSRSASRAGRPRASCTSSPTAVAGGTCTANAQGGSTRSIRRRRVRRAALGLRPGDVRLRAATPASSASSTGTAARTWHESPRTTTSSANLRRRSARSGTCASATASSPASPPAETEVEAIVRLDLASDAWRVLRRASDIVLDPGDVSVAEAIAFPGSGGALTHAFYYPPRNRSFTGPAGVAAAAAGREPRRTDRRDHPGARRWRASTGPAAALPSSTSTTAARPATAAPTASASTASGASSTSTTSSPRRASWSTRGDVDGTRLAIRGGSAGGYTTLAALTFRDAFHAGASHFGVSDLEALARETHKFESRYLDSLIGPWPAARRALPGALADPLPRAADERLDPPPGR